MKKANSGGIDRLQSLIETLVDAIVTIDEQGIIETVNPAVERLFGYAPDELIGKNVNTLMPQPYRKEHDGYLQNYLRSGKAKIIGIGREVIGRRKDGTTFPIDLAVSEFQHENRRMFTGVIRDITARNQMEASLQDSEERMRSVVETAVDGIFTIDSKGSIHTINPAGERIFGFTAEELIGKNIKTLMPEPYHSEHDGYLRSYLRTGKAKIIGIGREVVARKKDGTVFPIDLAVSEFKHGNERMFTGIVRDISQRKRTEIHLQVEHEISKILAESHSIATAIPRMMQAMCKNLECILGEFFVLDSENKKLRCHTLWTLSPKAKKVEQDQFKVNFAFGQGLPGRVWAEKVPVWIPDVSASDIFERKDYAKKQQIHTALGIPILFHAELVGVITLFSREKREPDQELLDMLASIGVQIGQFFERKRVENQLLTFEEKLRQAEKLMILGVLASEIAHEIGTPLNIISGRVELLGVREKMNELIQKEVVTINQQIERINRIVRDHLNVLRKTNVDQHVDLNSLLNSLIAFFQPYAEKASIDLDLSLNSVPPVYGNADELQQVFINLMMNAIQEMKKGGKLTVQSAIVSKNGKDFAEVRISDTGKGIPTEILDKIFEPFFSTKGTEGGTGLGLAIVRDIVRRHNGQIRIETELRKGSTFSIQIPGI